MQQHTKCKRLTSFDAFEKLGNVTEIKSMVSDELHKLDHAAKLITGIVKSLCVYHRNVKGTSKSYYWVTLELYDGSFYKSSIPKNRSTTRSLFVNEIITIIELSDQFIKDSFYVENEPEEITNNKLIAAFITHTNAVQRTYITECHYINKPPVLCQIYFSFMRSLMAGLTVWFVLLLIPILNNDIALLSGVSVFFFAAIKGILLEQPDTDLTQYYKYLTTRRQLESVIEPLKKAPSIQTYN